MGNAPTKLNTDNTLSNQDLSPQQNLSDLMVQYFEYLGISYVFGIPGGAIESLYTSLAHSQYRGKTRAINVCQESAAAYMADGYYRETGKLGVCLVTSGPGATNIITGVACAFANNIPMLVITGQPPIPSFGKGALQESSCTGVNVVNMLQHCSHYSSLVSHPDQLETKLVNALMAAFHSKGPTHLSIPADILRHPTETPHLKYNLIDKLYRKPSIYDEDGTRELFDILESSPPPVFFIGNGAADSIDSIMALVDLTNALFVTTPDAKGLINPLHIKYRGVFGLGGHSGAIDALKSNNSVTLAFGTSFGEFSTNKWSDILLNNHLVHIDDVSENFLRSPMARLHIRGKIHTICSHLVEKLTASLPNKIAKDNQNIPPRKRINPHLTFNDPEKYFSDAVPIKPQRLMKELSERFPPNTRFLADAGNSMIWTPHYLQPFNRRKRQLLDHDYNLNERRSGRASWLGVCLDFAPMGWAIGAAIGVARGNPKGLTVCITGDGSYLMSGQEITVAVREQLPLVVVVLNDGVYGMVMHGQRLSGAEPIGYELHKVDFSRMMEAMNINSFIIESPSDFDKIDPEALLAEQGPTLIDVRIDREETPPMMDRLKALGSV